MRDPRIGPGRFSGRNPFRGTNIMTPEVLGYAKGVWQGREVWIEVSQGRGMEGQRIWGVTVRRADGMELWRDGPGQDPSRCCHTWRQVTEVLDMLHAEA